MIKKSNMKKAAIENIFIWIVLFTMFASIFFFVIHYSVIIRAQGTIDSLADFGSNYVALNGVGDDLSANMDSIATANFNAINANTANICVTTSDNQYRVTFNVTSTNDSELYFYKGNLSSTKVVFNQDGTSNSITCDLSVTIKK